MLKKMSIRKIMIASFALFILLVLYLIPVHEEDNIEMKDGGIEYIYANNSSVIYLLDSDDYVARTTITSCDCDAVSKATDLILGLIIDGNKSSIIPNGFRSIIPTGTSILDINLENGILTIDFSKELLDINEKYEEKMIEALVYTLTNIKGIDKIAIKVEGEPLNELPNSKKKLPPYLDKEYGINKSYELTSMKDIDSFTVYYVNSYNDNKYYVPVTKYINNSSQDKIKVIIEELTSAPIYETNLMSYLNVNAKLLNYELEDDVLKLNFNEQIFNDINTNNILEEVIYTVSLSLSDMLDVNEIVFYVEDDEVYKSIIEDIM